MSSEWSAAMISPVDDFAGAPLLRAEFALDDGHGAVVSAELAVSSLGVFEAYLNGRTAGHDVLSPGWSSYEWRLRYRTYDVTDLLQPTTVLGISLGNGWSRGRLGWNGNRAFYGDRLAVIAQLEVAYADGHRQLVITDETWLAGPSATLANDLYDGQTIDARLVDDTWLRPGAAPAGLGQRRNAGVRHQPSHAVCRPSCYPPRGPPASGHLVVPVGSHAGGLRPEPRRLAALHHKRCGRDRDHRPSRRGSRARRAGRAAPSQRQSHRPVHPQRRRGPLRAHQDLPRLPIRRDYRLAFAADLERPWRRSSSTPTCGAPVISNARTRCSTSCIAT